MPSHSTSFSSSKFNLTSLLEEVQITNSVHNDLNQVITNTNSSDQNKVSLNNRDLQQQQHQQQQLQSSQINNSNQNQAFRMRARTKDVVVSIVSIP